MNKKAIYNQVLDFFSNLELPWDHFANDMCESYNDIFEDFFNSELPKNLSEGVQYHTGASKWVIDIKGFEFIIKIPYEGYYEEVVIDDDDYKHVRKGSWEFGGIKPGKPEIEVTISELYKGKDYKGLDLT